MLGLFSKDIIQQRHIKLIKSDSKNIHNAA